MTPTSNRLKLLNKKQLLAFKLRNQNLSFKQIGEQLNVGPQRARQIFLCANYHVKRAPHWTDGLTMRLKNVLNNLQINSLKEALQAYLSGKLQYGKNGTRNYGWKSHKEIAKWLGLAEPQKLDPEICPHCGNRLNRNHLSK